MFFVFVFGLCDTSRDTLKGRVELTFPQSLLQAKSPSICLAAFRLQFRGGNPSPGGGSQVLRETLSGGSRPHGRIGMMIQNAACPVPKAACPVPKAAPRFRRKSLVSNGNGSTGGGGRWYPWHERQGPESEEDRTHLLKGVSHFRFRSRTHQKGL